MRVRRGSGDAKSNLRGHRGRSAGRPSGRMHARAVQVRRAQPQHPGARRERQGRRRLEAVGQHAGTDIAFLPDGTCFVADGYQHSRVVKFDKDGKYLQAWGTFGSGPSQFNVVHGVAVDAQRRVYVGIATTTGCRSSMKTEKDLDRVADVCQPCSRPGDEGPGSLADDVGLTSNGQGRPRRKCVDLMGRGKNRRPGDVAGGHQFSVDSAGNFYVANFRQGVMKFVPKPRRRQEPVDRPALLMSGD